MALPNNIQKEHLLKAIEKIESEGIPSDADSQYYDVKYNGKIYPPKVVVSYANIFANGTELNRNTFPGGANTQCFNLLQKNGFEIVKKNRSYFTELKRFIAVADQQVTGQGTVGVQEFNQIRSIVYEDLQVEAKFGVGRASAIPWVAFLSQEDTVQNGIYPVYLYYKEEKLIILAYGISETNKPIKAWNLKNGISIDEYFLRNYSHKAEKYGNSFVFKAYDLKLELSEKEVDEDLITLISIYKSTNINGSSNSLENDLQNSKINKSTPNEMPFNINSFCLKAVDAGLVFSNQLIQRFIASLCTKPFVICSGLSGSGKTKLAQAFVHWISESDKQYKIIPVGADWTNKEPLLGYPNGLEPKSYVTPDSGALQLILEASKVENKNKPYFMILDEMNLSHVERYFADFLSIMESKEKLKLYSDGKRYSNYEIGIEPDEANLIPQEIIWPENLFIIGTVNIDETTYMFSPKVLDRANVIEFRINPKEMQVFLEKSENTNISRLHIDDIIENSGIGSIYGTDFIRMAKNNVFEEVEKIKLIKLNELNSFFKELQGVGAEFGYRTAAEIKLLIHLLNKNDDFITKYIKEQNNDKLVTDKQLRNHKIDIAIMQKLLPKLHGSRKKLVSPLETLAEFCIARKSDSKPEEQSKNKTLYQQFDSENGDPEKWEIIYPISFEKIGRMRKNVIENGFTSYAEA